MVSEALMAVSLYGQSRIQLLLGFDEQAAANLVHAKRFAEIPMPSLSNDIADFILRHKVLKTHIQNHDDSNILFDSLSEARRLNNEAIDLRNKGELKKAEELMRKSLEIEIEQRGFSNPKIAHRLNNLATILILRNNLEDAKQLLARAWILKAGRHDITSLRLLFVRLIVAFLESLPIAIFVGQLKTLLIEGSLIDYAAVDITWNAAFFLKQLKSILGDTKVEFLTILVAVINSHSKIQDLDRFPEWRKQSSIPIETPWPE